MHRALQRQLRRLTGVADEAALIQLQAEATALAGQAAVSPALGNLLSGLGEFLARVDGSYEQYERDLALRSRSLELSSAELGEANERLRAELASRDRALASLRDTASGLLQRGSDVTVLADNDLESISILMRRLVEEREAERRELDNQKFALDQHAIVSITDTQGIILYANERFCEISGYVVDELIGQTHRMVSSGVHPSSFFVGMWETIAAGQVWHGEVCNRKKSGELYWVSATIVPFLDAQGLPVRYIAIRTDITERKAIEARLQEQLRLVEEVIEAIPLPLYLKDREGRYLRLNKAFELFFAVHREEMLGRTLHDLLRPEDARLHVEMDEALFASGGTQVYEASVFSRDGLHHETIYRKAALTRPDGSISGLLGTIIDITERKEAEQTLRRAMEAAEAANRAKSDFLANMSHEIRTPMNGVIGMTDLALGTKLDEEQREYLQIVKSSADSLLTIINDILDFSKIEAGKLLLESISFDLPRLVSDSVKPLALRAHEKGLELVVDLDPALPRCVLGDPGRLRQILINLVGNAIKFTATGEVVVRVQPGSKPDLVHLQVEDTGIGIATEKLEHIFEAFTQEDTSTTRRFGGTGLGLTISHRLVTMMGGRLWVNSILGQGSVFHVELPLEEAIGESLLFEQPANLNGMHVVLVDDNETNRLVLSRILLSWRMEVVALASSEAVLAYLQGDSPVDLILLDAHMTGMDGFELAARLGADSRLSGIPKVMLSSGAMRGDADRCRELGVAAYFSKPIAPHELLAGLCGVLKSSAQADRPPMLVTRHTLRENRQGLNVLLVEDHPFNRKLAISLLEKWGHHVTAAENGQQALDRIDVERFDVILMDVQMPVMDGLETTRRLRAAGCTTRIVAMTANAMQGDRECCLQAGMDDYIAKPIRADDLFSILHSGAKSRLAIDEGEQQVDAGFDYASGLQQTDPEILEVLAPLVLEGAEENLMRLKTAMGAADIEQAVRQAHTLRGLCGSFNAKPVVDRLRSLESTLEKGDCDLSAIPAIETEMAAMLSALRVFRPAV